MSVVFIFRRSLFLYNSNRTNNRTNNRQKKRSKIMKTIKFIPGHTTAIRNKTVLDLEKFVITGQPNESAEIGKFGTGSKLAIAHYLREGFEVVLELASNGTRVIYDLVILDNGTIALSSDDDLIRTNIHKGFGSHTFDDKKAHLEIIYNAQDYGLLDTGNFKGDPKDSDYFRIVSAEESTAFYITCPEDSKEFSCNVIGIDEGEDHGFGFGNVLKKEDGYPSGLIFFKGVQIEEVEAPEEYGFSVNITCEMGSNDFRHYNSSRLMSWFLEVKYIMFGKLSSSIDIDNVIERILSIYREPELVDILFIKELAMSYRIISCPLSLRPAMTEDAIVIPEMVFDDLAKKIELPLPEKFLTEEPCEEVVNDMQKITEIANYLNVDIVFVSEYSPFFGHIEYCTSLATSLSRNTLVVKNKAFGKNISSISNIARHLVNLIQENNNNIPDSYTAKEEIINGLIDASFDYLIKKSRV